jgi:hypothetical protein
MAPRWHACCLIDGMNKTLVKKPVSSKRLTRSLGVREREQLLESLRARVDHVEKALRDCLDRIRRIEETVEELPIPPV